MIPLIILAPLAIAGGGALGVAHERFRRNRLATQISDTSLDESSDAGEHDPQAMASGDLLQIRYSERAAYLALGMSAAGGLLGYPALALASLPVLGYSIYNWLRTRYQFEQPFRKSPLRILALLALASSLATGHWLLAALVLGIDLGARRWAAQWTKGAQFIELESGDKDSEKRFALVMPSRLADRARTALRMMLQGEPRWEWFPHLLARVSLGLFFAISGWNKLFTVSHWKGLVSTMIATGIPFPKFMSLFLASVEFYGGSFLTIGFLTTFWAIALAIAMTVALVTVEVPMIIPPGLSPLNWLDWFLYLPQVMYILIFLWLIIKGPGPYSVDAVIARRLGLDKDKDKDSEESADEPEAIEAVAMQEDLLGEAEEVSDDDSRKPGGASWTPA